MAPATPDFPNIDAALLDSIEAVSAYLGAAFEFGNTDAMTVALATVARAPGLAHLAASAGIPRAELAAAFTAGEVPLDTLLAIMKVVDLHLPPGAPPAWPGDGSGRPS